MNIVDYLKFKYRKSLRYLNYLQYKKNFSKILKEKKQKRKIKILFFVMSVDMWKSNELFKLLLHDSRFEPYIIPQLLQRNTHEQNERIQNSLKKYFSSLNFPFIDAIDISTGEIFDAKHFEPDIVFCSQPYNNGLKEHKIKSLWGNVLFAYIPYCVNIELEPEFFSSLFQNICWKNYCFFSLNKEYESKLLYNAGNNLIVVGHPLFEQIENNRNKEKCYWKDLDHKKVRLIWAPHHSILPNDTLNYGNFLEMADFMIQLAKAYQENLEIAFKPHPILKEKLINLSGWGKELTDNYYDFWKTSPNTILAEGSYTDLFMTSDAMVHDSSSFICEYLYTKKPVMFISKNPQDIRNGLNELGKKCFDLHYKGTSIEDVGCFIDNVINNFEDYLESDRIRFFENELRQDTNITTSQLIFKDLKDSLSML